MFVTYLKMLTRHFGQSVLSPNFLELGIAIGNPYGPSTDFFQSPGTGYHGGTGWRIKAFGSHFLRGG